MCVEINIKIPYIVCNLILLSCLIKIQDCVQMGKLLILNIVKKITDGHGRVLVHEHEKMIFVMHLWNDVVMLLPMDQNNVMMEMLFDEMVVVLLALVNLPSISAL